MNHTPKVKNKARSPLSPLLFNTVLEVLDKTEKKAGIFPGGTLESTPANAGDTGSIPGPGRFHRPQSN